MNDCQHARNCHQAMSRELSVIIPCYNAGRYLSEAIESVLSQDTSVSYEVIVVNDHSTDGATLQALEYWGDKDSRVRVLHNCGPAGPVARNVGIEAATSEWLAFLDADDVWLPDSLESRWTVIEAEPDAEWMSADFLLWHEDGSIDCIGCYEKGTESRVILSQAYESEKVIRLSRPVREFLHTSLAWVGTIMVKRALMLRLGCFEPRLKQAEDLHMWVRLARVTDLFFVPKRVALYRQHGASLTHKDQAPELWSIAAYSMLLRDSDFRRYRRLIRRKLSFFHAQNTVYHRVRGERWAAVRAATNTAIYAPTQMRNWAQFLAATLGLR